MIEPTNLPDWATIPAVAYGEGYRTGHRDGYRAALLALVGPVFAVMAIGTPKLDVAGRPDGVWTADDVTSSLCKVLEAKARRQAWDELASLPRPADNLDHGDGPELAVAA